MTDEYGTDNEHEAGHEDGPEAETWQDDQPPVDDFADQPAEETATVSEEEGDFVPEDEEQEMDSPAKKKSVLLPVAAALGGLLFLGAVLYWQFGMSSPSSAPVIPPPPPLTTAHKAPIAMKSASVAANTATQAAPETTAPTTGLAPVETKTAPSSSSGVAVPAPSPATAPSTASASQSGTLSPEMLAKAPPSPAPAAAPALVTPASEVSTAATETPSAQTGTIDARLNALTTHVEELQKALAQTTQQLGQLSNMVAANAPVSGAGGASVDARLNKIEQQLMQLRHEESSPVTIEEPRAEKKPAARVTHHRRTTARKHATHETAKHVASVHWVLRAASPGEAWLSATPTAIELRHVQVGDTLSGIGRIRTIRQEGGGWVVEGSEGTIR